MFAILKDGTEQIRYSTREQCAADILVRGWIEKPIERYGMIFARGVEIVPVEEPKK